MQTQSIRLLQARKRTFGLMVAVAMLLIVLPSAYGSTGRDKQDKWGIEVVSIRTSAAGSMLDFRYKVVDAQKAEALFVRKTKPYLIHQESGAVLSVPVTAKVGPLRSTNKPKQDRIYWMFFGNKTKLVKPGDKITVTIGEFRAQDLIVE